jgi:hypothetical protein
LIQKKEMGERNYRDLGKRWSVKFALGKLLEKTTRTISGYSWNSEIAG